MENNLSYKHEFSLPLKCFMPLLVVARCLSVTHQTCLVFVLMMALRRKNLKFKHEETDFGRLRHSSFWSLQFENRKMLCFVTYQLFKKCETRD
jgi:hypothetical protein